MGSNFHANCLRRVIRTLFFEIPSNKKTKLPTSGNSAFDLRQSAFPQPFPKEWVLLSLLFTP